MDFKELTYKSKLKICELFYREEWNFPENSDLYPSKIYFSWSKVIFETKSGDKSFQRYLIEDWYNKNLKIVRKEKLLEIRKNLI